MQKAEAICGSASFGNRWVSGAGRLSGPAPETSSPRPGGIFAPPRPTPGDPLPSPVPAYAFFAEAHDLLRHLCSPREHSDLQRGLPAGAIAINHSRWVRRPRKCSRQFPNAGAAPHPLVVATPRGCWKGPWTQRPPAGL